MAGVSHVMEMTTSKHDIIPGESTVHQGLLVQQSADAHKLQGRYPGIIHLYLYPEKILKTLLER